MKEIAMDDGDNDFTLTVEVVEPKSKGDRDKLSGPKLWRGRKACSWDEALQKARRLLRTAGGRAVRVTDLLTQQYEIFRSRDDFRRFARR